MSMESIMGGLFLVNGTDIWTEYGCLLYTSDAADEL